MCPCCARPSNPPRKAQSRNAAFLAELHFRPECLISMCGTRGAYRTWRRTWAARHAGRVRAPNTAPQNNQATALKIVW